MHRGQNQSYEFDEIPNLGLFRRAKMYPKYYPLQCHELESQRDFLERQLNDARQEFQKFMFQCREWAARYQDWADYFGKKPNKEALINKKKDWWDCVNLCECMRQEKEDYIQQLESSLSCENNIDPAYVEHQNVCPNPSNYNQGSLYQCPPPQFLKSGADVSSDFSNIHQDSCWPTYSDQSLQMGSYAQSSNSIKNLMNQRYDPKTATEWRTRHPSDLYSSTNATSSRYVHNPLMGSSFEHNKINNPDQSHNTDLRSDYSSGVDKFSIYEQIDADCKSERFLRERKYVDDQDYLNVSHSRSRSPPSSSKRDFPQTSKHNPLSNDFSRDSSRESPLLKNDSNRNRSRSGSASSRKHDLPINRDSQKQTPSDNSPKTDNLTKSGEVISTYPFYTVERLVNSSSRKYRPEKIFWILRGLPFSGKTTFAEKISKLEVHNKSSTPIIVSSHSNYPVNEDIIFHDLKRIVETHQSNFVIYNAVNSKLSDFTNIKEIADQNGFSVYVVSLTSDPMRCSQRSDGKISLEVLLEIATAWECTPENYRKLDPTSMLKYFEMIPSLP